MDFEKLSELLDNGEQYGAGPARGCLIYKDGKRIYEHFAGFCDKENKTVYTGEQMFYVFSCSKVLTCTAAMMLYEQGKFSLSDPVEKYLPEFADKMVEIHSADGTVNTEPAYRKPEIYDLFTMSAGLDYNLYDEHIQKARDMTGGKADTLPTVREIVKRNLVIQPGSRWNYSLCHDVLAALTEIWSGKTFGEFITENILKPLGMNETFISEKTPIEYKRGKLYSYDDAKQEAVLCSQKNNYIFGEKYESGGAGISTTINDYIKLAEMLCHGGKAPDGRQIIKPETIDIMRKPAYDDEWQKSFGWENGFKYAMGVYVLDNPKKAKINGNAGTFGWDGAAGSYISIDPEQRISIFYMQNMFGGPIHDYRRLLLQAVYGSL